MPIRNTRFVRRGYKKPRCASCLQIISTCVRTGCESSPEFRERTAAKLARERRCTYCLNPADGYLDGTTRIPVCQTHALATAPDPNDRCYAERVAEAEALFPCKYGHGDCALTNRGRCVGEHLCKECENDPAPEPSDSCKCGHNREDHDLRAYDCTVQNLARGTKCECKLMGA